jgi:hypothetical protein
MCQATQAAELLQLTDSSATFTCNVQLVKNEGNGSLKTVIEPLTVAVATTQATPTKERQTTAEQPSLWRVGLKKGKFEVEKHLLTKTSKIKFLPGSPHPQGVQVDTWYSVVPSGHWYFGLEKAPIGAGAALPPHAALTVLRCQTGQFNVRDEAMKYHAQSDPTKKQTHWDSLRANRLLDDAQCGDFAKLFVTSHSKKSVNLFESEENGEFMFLMVMFCKEFREFSSFFSSDADRLAFHQSLNAVIQGLSKHAKGCQESRSELCHAFEKMDTREKATIGECSSIEQRAFENSEQFLSAIVTLCNELAKMGHVEAGCAAHEASMCLAELQNIKDKPMLITPAMQDEIKGMCEENMQLHEENVQLQSDLDQQRLRAEKSEVIAEALVHKAQSKHDRLLQVLQHDVLGTLNLGGSSSIAKLQKGWAAGSRGNALQQVLAAVLPGSQRCSLTWLHGQHGSGKSALLSQVVQQVSGRDGTVVLPHFFIFGDAASSIELSVALLCVKFWSAAFDCSVDAALKYFGDWVPSQEGVSVRTHLQHKSVDYFTALLLAMVKDAAQARSLSHLVIVFDALDECSDRHCELEMDGSITVSDAVFTLNDLFLAKFMDGMSACASASVSVIASSISKPSALPSTTHFINVHELRPSASDVQSFVACWLQQSSCASSPWVATIRDKVAGICSGIRDLRSATLLVHFVGQQAFVAMRSEPQGATKLSKDALACIDMTIELLANADMVQMVLTYISQSVLDASAGSISAWAFSVDAASAAICAAAYLGTSDPIKYARIAALEDSESLARHVQSTMQPLLVCESARTMLIDATVLDTMRRSAALPGNLLDMFTQRLKKCVSAMSSTKRKMTEERMGTTTFKNCCRALFDKQVLLSKVDDVFRNFDQDNACFALERLQYLFHLSLDGQSASCAADLFTRMCRLRRTQPETQDVMLLNPAELGQLCSLVIRAKARCFDDAAAHALRIADLEPKCKLLVSELKSSVFIDNWYEAWDLRHDMPHLVSTLQLLLRNRCYGRRDHECEPHD